MKRIIWISLLAIFVGVLFSACGSNGQTPTSEQNPASEMTLFVGPRQVDCQGGPQGKCYQVKYSENADWVNFADVIQGFDWEPGYEYELRLKVIESRPKNSDFIFRSFELMEVVSKTAAK
jgi:hypothetical protein